MISVTFEPLHETDYVEAGRLLLEVMDARRLNVLKACGGHGLCATCHVRVDSGMENLSPRTERERRTLSIVAGTDAFSRLACQTRVNGPVVIDLPQGMFIEKAEDLLKLLGTRAPNDILHPIKGTVLIGRGKIITRTQIEELRGLQAEVGVLRHAGKVEETSITPVVAPTASIRPTPSINSIQQSSPAPVRSTTNLLGSKTIPSTRPGRAGDPRNLTVGMHLGKCLLLEKLGSGSSGVVFRALQMSLNIPVAVKVLRLPGNEFSPAHGDPGVRDQLRVEARLLAQLNHPHIVRVWDFDEEHVYPHLVLELVEGPSLSELIQQCGRLTAERAVRLMVQVADALLSASEMGVVHRDVKPGNILLTRDGKAKLADLGLACSLGTSGVSGQAIGTVAYMAPEQAEGSEVDLRSDIYALGATLYHAVTGRLPFPGKTSQEVMLKHRYAPLEPAESFALGLPETLGELIRSMLSKSPEDRPQTYSELLIELREVLRETETAPVRA